MTAYDDLALELSCDYCGAEPGAWCRTKSGNRATWLHVDRTWLIQRAWFAGYEEADLYAARGYLRDPERFDRWARREVARAES